MGNKRVTSRHPFLAPRQGRVSPNELPDFEVMSTSLSLQASLRAHSKRTHSFLLALGPLGLCLWIHSAVTSMTPWCNLEPRAWKQREMSNRHEHHCKSFTKKQMSKNHAEFISRDLRLPSKLSLPHCDYKFVGSCTEIKLITYIIMHHACTT